MYAAMRTERLAYLIAHRPGLVAPTLAARKVATFDVLTGGRMALHIIAGLSDEEQQSEGDFLLKQDRYRRGSEYLEIMRRAWTSEAPFDFSGSFYQVRGAISDVKPYQKPYPPIFFGGSSEGALAMGAEHCDVFALFGEPLAETRERIADFRRRAAAFGRSPASTSRSARSSRSARTRRGTRRAASCARSSAGVRRRIRSISRGSA